MPNNIPDYFADIVQDIAAKSKAIRRDFNSHRLSAGSNREQLVTNFLKMHLPVRFAIDTGLIINSVGKFSKQADIVVVDALNNAPYHSAAPNPLWPVEAVYSLIEVKTSFTLPEIKDCIEKCRRFKKLNRNFADVLGSRQNLRDSLFVVWAFEAPDPMTVRSNVMASMTGVPRDEQVDMIVVPDSFVALSGRYREVSRYGLPGSSARLKELQRLSINEAELEIREQVLGSTVDMYISGENSLFAWFTWFDSWLRWAGNRIVDPATYVPLHTQFGTRISEEWRLSDKEDKENEK